MDQQGSGFKALFSENVLRDSISGRAAAIFFSGGGLFWNEFCGPD